MTLYDKYNSPRNTRVKIYTLAHTNYLFLRSYFDPFSNNKNIFTIPVGYQNGFENNTEFNVQKKVKRKFLWSFFGQIYSTRENMINELENIKPNYLHRTSSFMSSDIVSPEEVKAAYENSIFSPCPYGYLNPDSFRIMESLESGCIPIVKKFLFIDNLSLTVSLHSRQFHRSDLATEAARL